MKKNTQNTKKKIKRKRYGGSKTTVSRRRHRKSPEQCAICQEALHNGKKLYTTTCHHRFHKQCLVQSCGYNSVCPICRRNITDNCIEIAVSLNEQLIDIVLSYNTIRDHEDSDEILERWRVELRSLAFNPDYQFYYSQAENNLFWQAVDMVQRWDGDAVLVNPVYYEQP